MKNPERHLLRRSLLLGLSFAALASVALFAGCKGNTTSAAVPEHEVGKPPVLTADFVPDEMRDADPLTNPAWQQAAWTPFSPSLNHMQSTPPTKGASLYSNTMLYLAAVSAKKSGMPQAAADTLSFFLDSEGQGKELLEVRIDAGGNTACLWMRSNAPAQPLEDGSPNMGFPVTSNPSVKVPGLWSQVREASTAEGPVWTAVIGIPVASLPGPMRATPRAGTPWKVNMVRAINMPRGTSGGDRLEADLSPIFSGAQAVSPYRMADLQFTQP